MMPAILKELERYKWKIENERKLQEQVLQLSSALNDMFVAFLCLTREGGWDTLDEDMKQALLDDYHAAREASVGRKIPIEERYDPAKPIYLKPF